METAPRNCRFLSLVVVERVLTNMHICITPTEHCSPQSCAIPKLWEVLNGVGVDGVGVGISLRPRLHRPRAKLPENWGRAKGAAKGSCGETVVQKGVFGESVSSLPP